MTTTPHVFTVHTAPPTTLTSIDFFAGAGGTALGLHNAGFRHVALNERDKNAVATLTANMPHWNVVAGDITNTTWAQYANTIDLVQGGVPCQAFSTAGLKKGFSDTRGTIFHEFIRATQEINPRVVVMENVKGLLTHDKGRTITTMVQAFNDAGYNTAIRVLDASRFDVAQRRERLILIGLRKDHTTPIMFPAPRPASATPTLRDALRDVPGSPGAAYGAGRAAVLDLVPAGGNWRSLPKNVQADFMGGLLRCGGGQTGVARRLAWDEPCVTLMCSPSQKQTERCHPDVTRPLTVREYARVQSFPDEWVFEGALSSQYRQIGNAVPVNVGFFVGRAVVKMLLPEIVGAGECFVEAQRLVVGGGCDVAAQVRADAFMGVR